MTAPFPVAFLSLEYPPLPSGGIGTSLRTLARGLAARGHRVTVVGWGPEASFDDAGVRVRFLGSSRWPAVGGLRNRQRAARALRRLARAGEAALVETHDWCGPSAGMRLPCPIVVRCNGSDRYFGELTGRRVRARVAIAETLALRRAASVAAASRFTAERTRRLFHLRAPVRVIPNGIDPTPFRNLPPAEGPPTLLHFGTLVGKKGALDLPAIFTGVLAAVPEARLVIAGRDVVDPDAGSTWARMRDLMAPEARARTTYLGPVAPEAIPGLLAGAHVAIFPSYAEALPVSWIEAMAAALPIVGYRSGWAEELVAESPEEAVTGRLVPPGDTAAFAAAAAALLAREGQREALGTAARRRVEERFSVDAMVEGSLAWYRDVLAGNPGREEP